MPGRAPARRPVRQGAGGGAEPVDAGQPVRVAAEPAEVGHRVVVGLEDVEAPRRQPEPVAGVGADAR